MGTYVVGRLGQAVFVVLGVVTFVFVLLNLTGDRGASAVIDWRQALWLECGDPGILRDIDKPEDVPS